MCCRGLKSIDMKVSLVCPRNLNHKHNDAPLAMHSRSNSVGSTDALSCGAL